MLTVARCNDLNQALGFKMALEAAGITAFIPDEISAATMPYAFFGSSGGVRVQVADEDAEKAERIIQELREDS